MMLVRLGAAIETLFDQTEDTPGDSPVWPHVLIYRMWQDGELALWGRRKHSAVLVQIAAYHGLHIDWSKQRPTAAPAVHGTDFAEHQWDDLHISDTDLPRAVARHSASVKDDAQGEERPEQDPGSLPSPDVAALPEQAASPPILDSSKPGPMNDLEIQQWDENYVQAHVDAGTGSSMQKIWRDFNNDTKVKGRATRARVWRYYKPPPEWTKGGRRPGTS